MNKYFSIRQSCPGCKSTNSVTLCRTSYTKPPIQDHLDSFYSPIGGVEFEYLEGCYYILNECQDCGLIYQKGIPNEFLMSKLYEEWMDPDGVLERYRKGHAAKYFVWVAREIARVIQHLGMMPHQLKFFDFGLGWGSWCLIAKGFGCDVYGAELSQVRIDNAKSSGIKVISWEEIPNHQFNFINAEQVFEHLADPLKTLVHLKHALKPNGIIRINVPNGWDIKRRLKIWDWQAPMKSTNSLNPVAPLQHINCYSYEALVKMGQRAGVEATTVIPYRPEKTDSAKSIKAIAKRYLNLGRPGKYRKNEGSLAFFRRPIGHR